MTIDNIISRVRLAIDEETVNNADFGSASAGDSSKMDNIIKASIGTALQWVCINAPSELLTGNDGSSSTALVVDYTPPSMTDIPASGNAIGASFGLPSDYLRFVRVRCTGWHRAIMLPVSESSEEYLQLYDSNGANATVDRPQAALILKATKTVEVYPKPSLVSDITCTYIKDPLSGSTDYSDGTTVPSVPNKAHGAFIYYIAFLVLSAYGDSRSARMLEIAQMNLGK